jgi:hypothetical protein
MTSSEVDIRERDGGIVVSVHVKPRASRNRILAARAGRLELSVTAPPDGGKANAAVCRLLADELGIGVSRVRIERGHAARNKQVLIEGVSASELLRCVPRE